VSYREGAAWSAGHGYGLGAVCLPGGISRVAKTGGWGGGADELIFLYFIMVVRKEMDR
jgi:hypothetical protein